MKVSYFAGCETVQHIRERYTHTHDIFHLTGQTEVYTHIKILLNFPCIFIVQKAHDHRL